MLGPLWGTVSLVLFIGALGAIGVGLWNQTVSTYVPFLAAGVIVWVLIQTIVTESCSLFIAGQGLVRQMQFDYSILAYALVWRNLIAFLHNLVAYLLVAAVLTPRNIGWPLILVVPGLVLISLNAVWVSLLLGIACLRFRDLQQLVANLIQIAIFVTPIFWPPEVLEQSGRVVLVTLNPLYHMIQVVRVPLLNGVPSKANYLAVVFVLLAGWIVTWTLFGRFRKRIAYWS